MCQSNLTETKHIRIMLLHNATPALILLSLLQSERWNALPFTLHLDISCHFSDMFRVVPQRAES
jgi:hypothetical protein